MPDEPLQPKSDNRPDRSAAFLLWLEGSFENFILYFLGAVLLVMMVALSFEVIFSVDGVAEADKAKRLSEVLNGTMVVVGVLTSISFSFVRSFETVAKNEPQLTRAAHRGGEHLLFGLAGLILCALINFACHDIPIMRWLRISTSNVTERTIIAIFFTISMLFAIIGFIAICHTAITRQMKRPTNERMTGSG